MKIWTIDGNNVKRYGAIIAVIAEAEGKLGWKWKGEDSFYRIGFADRDKILADIKHFHRHNPPRLAVTFRSGRREVY